MSGALWTDRRFWPLFWTQFLAAFNDNLYKQALVIMITFRAVSVAGMSPAQMVALAGALFILPYFLFSATAGLLTDKLDKARVLRATKTLELGIMAMAAVGLWFGNVPILLGLLFLMGVQATLFGPAKYGILPQQLGESELVAANAYVEMGTNLAILVGTLTGGVLAAVEHGEWIVAGGVVVVAIAGRLAASFIPSAPPSAPDLQLGWDPIRPTIALLLLVRKVKPIWLAILGISWFWAYGSIFLSLFPTYTKDVLHGTEGLATLFLALFSVGTGVGSLLCERLSRDRVELGLVPLGALGMSLFTLDLVLIGSPPWGPTAEGMGVALFLSTFTGWRIAVDMWLLALSSGLLIVPLYTFVQHRSAPSERARVIAGNNVVNAVFIVGGQFALMALYPLGFDAVHILALCALVNAVVAIYMYSVVAEYLLRFTVWVLSNIVYRLKVSGHEHIPRDAPVVMVCNHVSFVDWFVIAAGVKTPVRFVMHRSFYDLPVVKYLFRQAQVIPIASGKEDPELLARSFDRISQELRAGWSVCIFPEGAITKDGAMQPFKHGIEKIIERDPVPVVPMALVGLWGSSFSHRGAPAMTKPFRRGFWSRVELRIGPPVPPTEVTAQSVQERVSGLLGGAT